MYPIKMQISEQQQQTDKISIHSLLRLTPSDQDLQDEIVTKLHHNISIIIGLIHRRYILIAHTTQILDLIHFAPV